MRTLVIGGAASGKSEYAEALACLASQPRYYIATMMPFDKEDYARIEKHRRMRAEKGFFTRECYTNLSGLILREGESAPDEKAGVLLECLGNLTANEMFSENGAHGDTLGAVLRGVEALEKQCGDLVVVSNNVHSDGGRYADETLAYLDTLGKINCALGVRFERVVEVVCGIPIFIKGGAQ